MLCTQILVVEGMCLGVGSRWVKLLTPPRQLLKECTAVIMDGCAIVVRGQEKSYSRQDVGITVDTLEVG